MAVLPFVFDPDRVPAQAPFELPDFSALAKLKSRRQWVAWTYEERDGKPTKVPINPRTGGNASVAVASTWGTYEQAAERADRDDLAGVGFVLTEKDEIRGGDLDHCRDPVTGEVAPWAQAIIDLAETYCEVSPSGTGIRFFTIGEVDKSFALKTAGVEVYRTGRYLTVTGNHLDGTPEDIQPAPQMIEALRARVETFRAEAEAARPVPKLNGNGTYHTQESGDFWRQLNAAALDGRDLWVPALFGPAARHQTTGAWRISSRALGRDREEDLSIHPEGIKDWGEHDMGDPHQGGRTPIDLVMQYGGHGSAKDAALWLCGRIGRAPAAFGWLDNEERTIIGAVRAQELIQARDGTLADARTGEVIDSPKSKGDELPSHLLTVPGLLGDVANWICATARRPQLGLALGAAMTVLGTACGRHLAGPTRSGTHLYVVGLAPTGSGKDHPLQQIGLLLAASGMRHHIGPSQFISMPAVINFLARAPLSVCGMDEFGAFLKRINNRRASGFEGAISGVLRTAWGSSFKAMPTPEWAGRASETIFCPALSIYGVSTAEEFYGALEGADAANGVLNRFLLIETRHRPDDREPLTDPFTVPDAIRTGLAAIYERGGPLVVGLLSQSTMTPALSVMPWADRRASDVFRAFVSDLQRRSDGDLPVQQFMARTAENAVRLAAIRAVGLDPIAPSVSEADIVWACELAQWSAQTLMRGASDHIADTENQIAANLVRRAIREAGGRIRHRELLRRLNHRLKNRDLHDVIKGLAEAEQIVVEKTIPAKGGPPSLWYRLG